MNFKFKKFFDIVIVIIAIIFFLWWIFLYPPGNFPRNSFASIQDGSSLTQIADYLKDKNFIKSKNAFLITAKALNKDREIKFGDYFFEKPFSVIQLVDRLSSAEFGFNQVKVTVPDCSSAEEIAEPFSQFENFDKDKFLIMVAGQSLEGYLFPDTYFVLPNINTEGVIKMLKKNFEKKISPLMADIEKSDYSLQEIIILASLIEREVHDYKDRRIVAGILWNRLEIEMPLQIDAVFVYLLDKKSSELTLDDLKIDSPYNTYLHKGLPPGAICSPSFDAIEAVLNPIKTNYLYYLSDKNGYTYFAETFKEHKKNKVKYL
ncbi:MAG: endolytic transglycosylase MltG [Patescibacteria group bacterium]